MTHDTRGSIWHRWDLHFHTPSSFDYDDKSVTDQQLVDRLVSEGIRVVAITDHHLIDVLRIQNLQRLGGDELTVLPGIELRSDQGGEPIHYTRLSTFSPSGWKRGAGFWIGDCRFWIAELRLEAERRVRRAQA